MCNTRANVNSGRLTGWRGNMGKRKRKTSYISDFYDNDKIRTINGHHVDVRAKV